MCEFATYDVFPTLKSKEDQDMMKYDLESICYRLPNCIECNCESFVETYTSSIINLIMNALTPDVICSALNLCILCVYVITTLDMLEDNHKEEIEKILDALRY